MTRNVCALLLIAGFLSGSGLAKDKDLATVIGFMENHFRSGDEFELHVYDADEIREIVFTSGDFKYSIYYSNRKVIISRPFMIVQVGLKDAKDNNGTESIIDTDMDGVADHGGGWHNERLFDRKRGEGLEYRDGYQKLYRQAIGAALQMIADHRKAGKCPCSRKNAGVLRAPTFLLL